MPKRIKILSQQRKLLTYRYQVTNGQETIACRENSRTQGAKSRTYVHMHVFIHIYTCTPVHTINTYMETHIHTQRYTHIHTYTWTHKYMEAHVHKYTQINLKTHLWTKNSRRAPPRLSQEEDEVVLAWGRAWHMSHRVTVSNCSLWLWICMIAQETKNNSLA